MKHLLALVALAVAFQCADKDKVYPVGTMITDSVYRCSSDGKPDTMKKAWICRGTLEEGYDEVLVTLPLCPGALSEYDQLLEQKPKGYIQ